MIRVTYKIFLMLICLTMLLGTTASADITTDDILYNTPDQFLDDFFSSLTMGNTIDHETEDASLVLRRLYQFSESINNNDYITAWQTLVNLPEHHDIPVISEIRNEALAIQSIIPWFSDRELKSNFITTYDEIWLKYDDVQDDYKKFKDVFSGYASRKDKDNPGTFIRNHLSYYGYSKSASQPSSDVEFIWELFKNYSLYSDSASKRGFDTRNADPEEYGKSFMKRTARNITDAWNEAIVAEKIRSGSDVSPDPDINDDVVDAEISIVEETNIPNIEQPKKIKAKVIDYSRINVFKLPDDAEYAIYETYGEEDELQFADSTIEIPNDEPTEIKAINPFEDTEGLEPPEPITERRFPDVVNIPSGDSDEIAIEEIPIIDDDDSDEITIDEIPVETNDEDESTDSVFVNPDVVIVDNRVEEDNPDEVITIPPVVEPIVEPIEESIEESDPVQDEVIEEITITEIPVVKETTNDSDEMGETINLLETEKITPIDEVTPVVEEVNVTDAQELKQIIQRLTNRLHDVAEELGTNAVDMVVLWSSDPEKVENYPEKEEMLETSFRVKKEEFLALLYLNDAFRFENSLETTFDALNGKVIGSLMKGFENFKARGGLADNPNVQEEELLRAIGQLTQGVEDRRDSLKIQTASLKAFKLRKSQFKSDIAKLELLTGIEISDQ